MIRLKLLSGPRQKRGKHRSAAASSDAGSSGSSVAPFLLGGLVLGLLVLYFGFYGPADKQVKDLDAKITRENQVAARLANIDKKYEQRNAEKAAFEKRVKVIDQL